MALKEKLNSEWHTEADLVTDENGCCTLYGYRGNYELSAGSGAAALTLKKGMDEIRVTL